MTDISYTVSSGNIFEDIGHPEPEEALLKAQLVNILNQVIQSAGYTQAQAAAILGIDQPKVSALARGKISGFSIDRLLKFMSKLNQEIEIILRDRPASSQSPKVSVKKAS